MMKALKVCVPAVVLCVFLSHSLVNAQDAAEAAPAAEAPAAVETPAVTETLAEPVYTPAEPAPAEAVYTPAETPMTEAEAAAEETAQTEEPAAETDAAPVVEVAEEEAEEEEAAEEVVEVAEAPAAPQVYYDEDEDDGDCRLSVGVRIAMGASSFHKHKIIRMPADVPYYAPFGTAHSMSMGLSLGYDLTDMIGIVLEAQYTIYNARNQFHYKTAGADAAADTDFGALNEAGVELHAVEVPVLVRFSNFFGPLYAEVGPQVGANVYGKIYANHELRKPLLNDVAFGPAVGVGVKYGSAAIGVRGYYNVLEYAENSGGYPWTVQAGITIFAK